MSFALEYLITSVNATVKKRCGTTAPDLFEWYAALFPDILRTGEAPYPTLADVAKLRGRKDGGAQDILGCLRRRRAPYRDQPAARLAERLEQTAQASGALDSLDYLRGMCETVPSNPWNLAVSSPDLMGLADSAFFGEYLRQLNRDFTDDASRIDATPLLRCYEQLCRGALSDGPYRQVQRAEVIALLIWVALVGPGGYRAFIDTGDPDARTREVEMTATRVAVAPRIVPVLFASSDPTDFHICEGSFNFNDGDAVTLTRALEFRACGGHEYELGVGDGSPTFSRRQARIEFAAGGATLSCPAAADHPNSQSCLVIRYGGGFDLVRAGEPPIVLRSKDVIALAPIHAGRSRLVPRPGRTGVMVDF